MLRPAYLLPAFLLLLLSARPLPAQSRRAELESEHSRRWVPLPEAVRAAYRRLPVTGRTADIWTAWVPEVPDTLYEVSYTALHVHAADTLSFTGSASFTGQGRQRDTTRELPADSLPWRVRWRLRYDRYRLHRHRPGTKPVLVVAYSYPDARRRHSRACYVVYFHHPRAAGTRLPADAPWPFTEYSYYRSGGHIPHPKFRN